MANGMVERFNRSMEDAIQAGKLEGKPLRESAQEFVQCYRATPHSATGESPSTVMHGGRRMETKPFHSNARWKKNGKLKPFHSNARWKKNGN